MTGMRSPLGRVKGLGSARSGSAEWWAMRLTSIALVPLSLWWVVAVIAHAGAEYDSYIAWVASPITAILLILTITVTLSHTARGVGEVIEDYIHVEWQKLGALIIVKFGCILLGVAGVFSVLKIAFGS